jgi:hypothetical protein
MGDRPIPLRDAIALETDHGQRLLASYGNPEGQFRVRILTEEAIQALSDDDFHRYRTRVHRLRQQVSASPLPLQDVDTIRAWDYLRNAVRRESVKRGHRDG